MIFVNGFYKRRVGIGKHEFFCFFVILGVNQVPKSGHIAENRNYKLLIKSIIEICEDIVYVSVNRSVDLVRFKASIEEHNQLVEKIVSCQLCHSANETVSVNAHVAREHRTHAGRSLKCRRAKRNAVNVGTAVFIKIGADDCSAHAESGECNTVTLGLCLDSPDKPVQLVGMLERVKSPVVVEEICIVCAEGLYSGLDNAALVLDLVHESFGIVACAQRKHIRCNVVF